MQWFGPSWGAAINVLVEQCETPVGSPCAECERVIAAGDRGLVLPFVSPSSQPLLPPAIVFHLACFLASVGLKPPDNFSRFQ